MSKESYSMTFPGRKGQNTYLAIESKRKENKTKQWTVMKNQIKSKVETRT